jgi:hypothetical protein
MNTIDNIHAEAPEHLTVVDASEEVLEVTGAGLRVAEVALVVLVGLLVCPPLLILAVIVAVPALAITALVAAVVAAIAVPTFLVRRVRAHHRAHGTTLFLHRLRR